MKRRTELDQLLGKRVICVADQAAFISGVNDFGVLFPLMFDDGTRVERHVQNFPNRGRIWWMLDYHINPGAVRPGMLFTARLEEAIDFDFERAEKDYFQARKSEVQPGPLGFLEVVELPHLPAPRELQRGFTLEMDHPPASRVLLAGKDGVLGPLRTEWSESGTVSFSVVDPADPVCYRGPRAVLSEAGHASFIIHVNQWHPAVADQEIQLGLVPESIEEDLQSRGARVYLADEKQIVSWGLKQLGLSRRQGQNFRDFLERARNLPPGDGDPSGRLELFREICADANRVAALGEGVARLLQEHSEHFESLVARHVEALAWDQVVMRVAERKSEIDRACQEHEERRRRLEQDVEKLAGEYAAKAAKLEAEFQVDHGDRLRELEEREQLVEQQERQLAAREETSAARLEALIERYESAAQEVADQVLTTLPVLGRLGLVGGAAGRGHSEERSRAKLQLPAHLNTPRARGELDEPAFLQQFHEVVKQRGFVFDPDDLANFHLSVKTGTWTVLAGPSGTGKSSVPRLYAEALGVADEYLALAVRPDWLDDRDLLGAFNALSRRFEPSVSGLVDHLIAAHEDGRRDRGGIYFVCLDEMNLARVEHYFSQFLSILERPESERFLELFARGQARPDDPYSPYRSLRVARNLRFVGTVNVDETTHFFSPKVLDRASIVLLEDIEGAPPPPSTDRIGGLAPVHLDEYRGWIRNADEIDAGVLKTLEILESKLREARFVVGHRSRRRLRTYLASAHGILSKDRAIDLAVAQMVLPRLRAMTPGYARLLEQLRDLFPAERYSRSARIIEALLESGARYDFFQIV